MLRRGFEKDFNRGGFMRYSEPDLSQGSVQKRLLFCLSVCLMSHWSPRIFNKYSNSWECAKGSMFEERGKDPLIIPASNEQGGEPKSPDCELASSLGSGRLRGIVVCSAYGSVHALAHITFSPLQTTYKWVSIGPHLATIWP